MTTKRFSIRRKMQIVVLMISVIALLLSAVIGIVSMLNIQKEVLSGSDALGDHAAYNSGKALIEQMEKSLFDIVSSKAELADAKLGAFASYAELFARYTETLYRNPEEFVPVPVLPPDKANKNILSMQRYLADDSFAPDMVLDEINLLGNLAHVFEPVISENEEIITTIYVGTVNGFLLSYDTRADLGDTESFEEYYAFDDSAWYTLAKQTGKTIFTDAYLDSYGRGLTISCAAPFYRAGEFWGVVCMDILVTDLNNSIIDVNIGSGSFAFLVNTEGDVIASPEQDPNSEDYVNILKDTSASAYDVSGDILSGTPGVILSGRDIYYAYTPLSSASWTLAISVPEDEITQPAIEIRSIIVSDTEKTSQAIHAAILAAIRIFTAVFLVIMIAVTVFSDRFSHRLTVPLISLREDVGIISRGNLEHRAVAVTNDEIGDLAGAFNNMTCSLQTYITNLTAVTAERERIGAELDVATKIQASMLPCIFPAFPERAEFDIYASMQPAKEVGGDFYDFFMVNENTLAVVMADVSGKGIPAALFMVITKTLLKNNAQYGKSPKEAFETVNNLLCEGNEAGMFVTAFMGYLDVPTGKLTYVNAGHNPPLIRLGKRFDWLKVKPGFILAGMEDTFYKQYEVILTPGDELFLYTDGATEAINKTNELFSDPKLLEVANSYLDLPIKEFTVSIKREIDKFAEGAEQADDITMLSLRYWGRRMIELTVEARIENLAAVLDFVNEQLGDFPSKARNQIGIAVDEIFSNIARYAYQPNVGNATIRVAAGDEIIIEFEDSGVAFNPLSKEDPDTSLSVDEREIGGLGIFMVKKIMDSVEYKREGDRNIVTIKKL